MMKIIELDRNNINDIKFLWAELNLHHYKSSAYFKDHFKTFTFEKRIQDLIKKDKLSIFVIQSQDKYIGYCIVTANNRRGEIDSIYIQPKYRNEKLGDRLMKKALEWFKAHQCNEIRIYVAEGNDAVLPFYRRYGFFERFIMLTNKTT
jgi:ribosomal protein S18 acetylase RimI-like enzyme